jgi:hypothetical protein
MIMNSNQRRLQDEPVVTDGTVEELRKTTRNKSYDRHSSRAEHYTIVCMLVNISLRVFFSADEGKYPRTRICLMAPFVKNLKTKLHGDIQT